MRAATSASENFKTLLEREKAQCSKLQKELTDTQELVAERTLQHAAVVEVVESQKQKVVLLQDKILQLQEDLQACPSASHICRSIFAIDIESTF